MGLAFSQATDTSRKIVIDTISIPAADADGSTLIAGLDAIVTEAGWVQVSAYENGYLYEMTSPQGLKGRCRIYQPPAWVGVANYEKAIAMEFLSVDGLRVGVPHPIYADQSVVGSFTELKVWANCCQIFTWRPSLEAANPSGGGPAPGWCVQGGVPYSPVTVLTVTQCLQDPVWPVDECAEMWWSAGDEGGAGGYYAPYEPARCLRNSYLLPLNFSACYNGQLYSLRATSPLTMGVPGIRLPFSMPAVIYPWHKWTAGPTCAGVVWHDGTTPLYLDPMLAWGLNSVSLPVIRGQLWDAVLCTKRAAFDATLAWGDPGQIFNWINYMRYGDDAMDGLSHVPSLYLLTGPTPASAIANVAY